MSLQSKDPARLGAAGPLEMSCERADNPKVAQNDPGAQAQFGLILGIDIGVTGGIAILSAAGELIEVHSMPCLADGPTKRRCVNAPLLAALIYASHATRAFVEHVSARPGEGVGKPPALILKSPPHARPTRLIRDQSSPPRQGQDFFSKLLVKSGGL
jgi:hypothetical protein